MQIVIELNENDFIEVSRDYYSGTPFENRIFYVVANGIPLPKGHGRLIDADKINDSNIEAVKRNGKIYVELSDLQNLIDNAPTVLEADKEQESEFNKKARYAMNESGYLDQGITQC